MNVTATTFPRRSLSDSLELSCVVSVKSGAGPIFDSRASDFAACPVAGMDQPTAMSAAMATTHRARPAPMLALQLLPELVDKPPIGVLGKELLRVARDETSFVEAERIEAQRILDAVLAPLAIRGDLLERLERVVVALCESPIHEQLGDPLGFQGAHLAGLEDGPKRPLRRHRILAHELPITDDDATQVLGPRPVHLGVDEHVADLLRAKLLRIRREKHGGI